MEKSNETAGGKTPPLSDSTSSPLRHAVIVVAAAAPKNDPTYQTELIKTKRKKEKPKTKTEQNRTKRNETKREKIKQK